MRFSLYIRNSGRRIEIITYPAIGPEGVTGVASSFCEENTAYSVGIGEALEVLETGIFGIYILEFLNIAMETSGAYDHDPSGGMLILPLAFWIVVSGGIAGVYFGWRLLQRIKHRTIKRFSRKLS